MLAACIGMAIFASIIAWSYFLATAPHSELGIKTVIDTILEKGPLDGSLELLGKVFTIRFTLFALLLPLTLALISLLPFYYGRAYTYSVSLGASFLALLPIIVLLGFSKLGIVLAIFFGIGVVAILELTYLKKGEFKKLVTFRSVASSCKTGLLVISIGVLLTSGYAEHRDNEKSTKKIGDELISLAFRQDVGQSGLTDNIADLTLQAQKQSLALVSSTPQFEKLREKTDPDVQLYVITVDKTREALDSPELRQKTIDELNKRADGMAGVLAGKQLLTIDVLRKQSPMLDLIFTYYWLFAAIGTWTTFLMFANIVLVNLAGIYAAAIRKIIGLAGALLKDKMPSAAGN